MGPPGPGIRPAAGDLRRPPAESRRIAERAARAGLRQHEGSGEPGDLRPAGRSDQSPDAAVPVLGRAPAGAGCRGDFPGEPGDRPHGCTRTGTAPAAARSALHRQHLHGPRRGPGDRRPRRGAGPPAGYPEGGRGPGFRPPPRRQPAGNQPGPLGQREGRRYRAGRQHAHPAARQELLPGQPPHPVPQDPRSPDGGAAGTAFRQGRPALRLRERDLSGPGGGAGHPRLWPGEPVLLRTAAGGARAAGDRAAGRHRAGSLLLRSAAQCRTGAEAARHGAGPDGGVRRDRSRRRHQRQGPGAGNPARRTELQQLQPHLHGPGTARAAGRLPRGGPAVGGAAHHDHAGSPDPDAGGRAVDEQPRGAGKVPEEGQRGPGWRHRGDRRPERRRGGHRRRAQLTFPRLQSCAGCAAADRLAGQARGISRCARIRPLRGVHHHRRRADHGETGYRPDLVAPELRSPVPWPGTGGPGPGRVAEYAHGPDWHGCHAPPRG